MKIKLSLLAFLSIYSVFGSEPTKPDANGVCYAYSAPSTGHFNWIALGNASMQTAVCDNHIEFSSCGYLKQNGFPGCNTMRVTQGQKGTYYYCYAETWELATTTPAPCSLSQYNNNADGCHSAGGLLFPESGSNNCYPYSEFAKKLLASPSSIIGAGFFVNGLLFTSAGLVGAGLGGGLAASAFATAGAYAMLLGAGTAIFGNASAITSNLTPTPSSDVMATPKDRVKVSVDQYQNTQVATADTSTGRVTEISTIPPEVKQRIIDGTVNPTTGQPNLAPSDFAGTRSTSYDYVAKVATTKTIQSDGTVKTQTAPILTQTNTTTGVVSTYSADTAVAPDVIGTTGSPIVDPNWSNYKTIASWTVSTGDTATGTGTGTMTGTNTGGGISGGGATGTGVNPADGSAEELYAGVTLDDGSTRFEGLTDAVTSQYGGFVNNNPLDITCSSNVETYSFNLMGRNFILFDKALVDKLPVALIKGIFLFVAAISGLILTFAGGA